MLCSKATGQVKGIADVSAIGNPVGVKTQVRTTVISKREQMSTQNGGKLRDGTISHTISENREMQQVGLDY